MTVTLDFSWIPLFLDSQFFSGFSTIITGLIAIYIYFKQKQDEKIKVARILLIEINDCENLIDSLKNQGINLVNTRKILSINSWEKYKHLFARDLNERELKLIDNFYQQCTLLNLELEEAYSLPNHTREKLRIMIENHAIFSKESENKEEYEEKKKLLNFFEKDDYWYQAESPKKFVSERIKNIQYISSTLAIQKIKEISDDRKWF